MTEPFGIPAPGSACDNLGPCGELLERIHDEALTVRDNRIAETEGTGENQNHRPWDLTPLLERQL
jgi:hypothetical protein